MKFLITCLFYRDATGSELYIHDLAHELWNRGHQVDIYPQLPGPYLVDRTNGPRIVDYIPEHDIILAQHHQVSAPIIQATTAPVVYTCHSEVYTAELPYASSRVFKYIAVRQEIADKMMELGIEADRIEVIHNGVDLERFKPREAERKYVFVPGTNDPVRHPMYQTLFKEVKGPMLFLGMGTDSLPDDPRITTHEPTWDIEDFYPAAQWVAGLFKGRTQYEAWAMDREFKAYDWKGEPVPMEKPADFEQQHGLVSVVDRLEGIYKEAVVARSSTTPSLSGRGRRKLPRSKLRRESSRLNTSDRYRAYAPVSCRHQSLRRGLAVLQPCSQTASQMVYRVLHQGSPLHLLRPRGSIHDPQLGI